MPLLVLMFFFSLATGVGFFSTGDEGTDNPLPKRALEKLSDEIVLYCIGLNGCVVMLVRSAEI